MEDLTRNPPCEPHGRDSVGICVRCDRLCCPACLHPGSRVCVDCPEAGPRPSGREPTEQSFRWIVEQEGWFVKLLVCGLMMFGSALIVPFLIFEGYRMRVTRQAMVNPSSPLPELRDLLSLIGEGFRYIVAMTLPIFALIFGMVLIGAGVVAIGFGVGGGAGEALAVMSMMVVYLACLALGLAYNAVQPAILLEFIATGSVLSGFRLKALFRHVSARFGDYIVLVVIGMAFNFVAGMVGLFTCYIGMVVTLPWAQLSFAYLVGCYVGRHYPEVARREGLQSVSWDQL